MIPSTEKLRTNLGAVTTARSTDPLTSHVAAAGITAAELTLLQKNIVGILTDMPLLTDEGIYEAYCARNYPRRTPQRLRTAREEITAGHVTRKGPLRDALIRDSGVQKQLPSGYWATCWQLIPGGVA